MPKKSFPQIVSLPIIKVNRCDEIAQRSIGIDNFLLEPLSTSPYRKMIPTSEIKIPEENVTGDKWSPILMPSSSSDDEMDKLNGKVNHELKGNQV